MTIPTHTIDSGTINKVPFPLTSTGTSLVQLLGSISVTGTVGTITRSLSVGAATGAKATVSSPLSTSKARLSATSEPTATCTVNERLRVTVGGATSTPSVGASTTDVHLKLRIIGSSGATPNAATSSGAMSRVTRSGSTTATATGVAGSRRLMWMPASGIEAKATTISGAKGLINAGGAFTVCGSLAISAAIQLKIKTYPVALNLNAVTSAGAVDFTSSMRASNNRTMYVPQQDRRMEVTA